MLLWKYFVKFYLSAVEFLSETGLLDDQWMTKHRVVARNPSAAAATRASAQGSVQSSADNRH